MNLTKKSKRCITDRDVEGHASKAQASRPVPNTSGKKKVSEHKEKKDPLTMLPSKKRKKSRKELEGGSRKRMSKKEGRTSETSG